MTNKKEYVVGTQVTPRIETDMDVPVKGFRFHRSMIQVSISKPSRQTSVNASTSIKKQRVFAD